MSKTVSLAFVLVLLAAAGAAQVPEISKTTVPDNDLMAALEAEIFGGVTSDALCFAIADCYPYSSVSCWSSSEGESCEGVDRDCAVGNRGARQVRRELHVLPTVLHRRLKPRYPNRILL